jgi:hypothetical protein
MEALARLETGQTGDRLGRVERRLGRCSLEAGIG